MLTCFNLKPECSIEAFRQSVDGFYAHLKAIDLIHSSSPIGRRQSDTIMDTDQERNHEYFFTSSFRDRAQCDRAVAYIQQQTEPGQSIHKTVYSKIVDEIFICWEDI